MFDAEFNDAYYGSIVGGGGPYHRLLRSDEQSPSAGTAVEFEPRHVPGVTVGCPPTTTCVEAGAGVGGATSGTCCLAPVSYPPTASTSDKPLVPAAPTTISYYNCASSAADSVIPYQNSVDIQSRLSSSNQVNRKNIDLYYYQVV